MGLRIPLYLLLGVVVPPHSPQESDWKVAAQWIWWRFTPCAWNGSSKWIAIVGRRRITTPFTWRFLSMSSRNALRMRCKMRGGGIQWPSAMHLLTQSSKKLDTEGRMLRKETPGIIWSCMAMPQQYFGSLLCVAPRPFSGNVSFNCSERRRRLNSRRKCCLLDFASWVNNGSTSILSHIIRLVLNWTNVRYKFVKWKAPRHEELHKVFCNTALIIECWALSADVLELRPLDHKEWILL
jgi:hypothetical protein